MVSWTSVITGYAQYGHEKEVLNLFCKMQQTSTKINHVTLPSVLSSCANLIILGEGKQMHAHIIRTSFDSCMCVGNALVTMYAKSGSIDDSCEMFDGMSERDLVSWNAMIAGGVQHGHGKEALQFFEEMLQGGMKLDHINFIGVLSACSHVGLVNEGHEIFNLICQDHYSILRSAHYACMFDLVGWAGCLDEAEDFINSMPYEPDASVWGALLGVCRMHGSIKLGKRATEQLFELEPENPGKYVLLSNIYAAASKFFFFQWIHGRLLRQERNIIF